MDRDGNWTRLLLAAGAASIVTATASPLLYRVGWVGLETAFLLLAAASGMGAVTVVAATTMAVVFGRRGLSGARNLLVAAALLGMGPLAVAAPPLIRGASLPPIHDVTTDPDDPPQFRRAVALRGDAANPLTYGAGLESPAELARRTAAAYPEIRTLRTGLDLEEAVARAQAVLESQGHRVVNVEVGGDEGIVEAVATTFWFGFQDDLVVRVRRGSGGSVVDVRSVSRVGRSDLGANAARIKGFLEEF